MAEAIAQVFLRSQSESGARMGSLPTLFTEANRSAGREATKRKGPKLGMSHGLGFPRACHECGVVLEGSRRKHCGTCFPGRREAATAIFASVGPAALAKRRAEGTDPAHTVEARRKQGLRATANVRANQDWDKSNPSDSADLDFEREILPRIQTVPLSRIMEATGLSLRYSSLIRRGSKVPHRRHWTKLQQLTVDGKQGVKSSARLRIRSLQSRPRLGILNKHKHRSC